MINWASIEPSLEVLHFFEKAFKGKTLARLRGSNTSKTPMAYCENNCIVRETTSMSRERNIQLILPILSAEYGESGFLCPLPEPSCWPGRFRMTFINDCFIK